MTSSVESGGTVLRACRHVSWMPVQKQQVCFILKFIRFRIHFQFAGSLLCFPQMMTKKGMTLVSEQSDISLFGHREFCAARIFW